MMEEILTAIEHHPQTTIILIVALWIYGTLRSSSITVKNYKKEE